GWRSIFAINVPAGMIIILLTILKIKGDWAEKKGEKFDLPGSAIYGLTVTLLMYGFSMLPSLTGAILILGGIIGVLTFIKWENRVSNPMVDIRLFIHNKAFAFSNLAALLNYSATYSVIFLMSLYLQYVKGLSAEKAGLIMITQPIIQAIVTPLAGRLSDKIEPRIVASTGMAITSLGLFLLFGFLNESTSPPQIIAFLLILGLGFALFSSPNTNAIMSSVKPGNYGLAGATMNTMRSTGQMLSMGITMLLFAVYMGPVIIRPEYYPSFLTATKLAFAVSATLCFAGIFASLARGNIRADAGKANGNASTATPATEKGKS
ncbi:MAG: MFS transporter, partial [Dehalococcoidia bacterium]|nr:MFS transporter [Dehalococcoidia bacterium]